MPRTRLVPVPRPYAGDPSTVSGPAAIPVDRRPDDALTIKALETDELASRMPFNANKPSEYGDAAARAPLSGDVVEADDPIAGASTVQEKQSIADNLHSLKVGLRGPTLVRGRQAGIWRCRPRPRQGGHTLIDVGSRGGADTPVAAPLHPPVLASE